MPTIHDVTDFYVRRYCEYGLKTKYQASMCEHAEYSSSKEKGPTDINYITKMPAKTQSLFPPFIVIKYKILSTSAETNKKTTKTRS